MSGFKKETKKCCGAVWDCDDTYQPIMCFFFPCKVHGSKKENQHECILLSLLLIILSLLHSFSMLDSNCWLTQTLKSCLLSYFYLRTSIFKNQDKYGTMSFWYCYIPHKKS